MEETNKEETLFECILRKILSLDNEDIIICDESIIDSFIFETLQKNTLKKLLEIENLNDKIIQCIGIINTLYHNNSSKEKLEEILKILRSNVEFDYFKGHLND